MLALFLFVVFGLGMALFATQNTGLVHLTIGGFLFSGIPIYVIVLASLLVGILVSWLISLVNSFSTSFTIHGKESQIRRAQHTIEELRQDKTALEKENIRLKGETKHELVVEKHEDREHQPDELKPYFLQKLRFG